MSMIDPKGTHLSALRQPREHDSNVRTSSRKPRPVSAETKQKQDAAIRFLRENGPHS